jgi:hypothetical protein
VGFEFYATARCSQYSSIQLDKTTRLGTGMALALFTVHSMPDCLNRQSARGLHAVSTIPEPIHKACGKKPFSATALVQYCHTPAENLKLTRNIFNLQVSFLEYSGFGHTCPILGTTYF